MKLSNKIINEIQPTGKEQEISDTGKGATTGLKVRVSKTGGKTFYLIYIIKGKKKKYRIDRFGNIGLPEARKIANKLKAEIHLGKDPQADKVSSRAKNKTEKLLVLRTYLDEKYYPYIENDDDNHRTPGRTKQIMEYNFKFLMQKKINNITKWDIDKWQKEKRDNGIKNSTINRAITVIKAALNHAVKCELIEKSPLKGREKLPVPEKDNEPYLFEDEEARLYKVLDKRTGYFPVFIRLLLNTGMRPKEALTLKWNAVDLKNKIVTVIAEASKNKKTRNIPLNSTIFNVLEEWKEKSDSDFVFPSYNETGHITTVQRIWKLVLKEANIKNSRLYDCRHTFASKLAMKGVEIYRISELLGHSSVEMTKVYAHLSPDYLSDAVNLIG